MANTPVEFFAPSGLALTLKLYLQDSPDTEAASVLAMEHVNAKGYYTATIAAAVVGRCNASVVLGSSVVAGFIVDMLDDVAVKRPIETAYVQELSNGALESISTEMSSPDGSLAAILNLIGADVHIDKTTDLTCYHLVYRIKGTLTEIARKELRDIDGAKINVDTKIPRQLLEVIVP